MGLTKNNEELPPKDCPPFHEQLTKILNSKGLKETYLRNKKVISRGLSESIFNKHSIPQMENVIKITNELKISLDELVGRV